MYQYLVISRNKSDLVESYSKSNNKYKQNNIIQMFDLLIDNTFVQFVGHVFQQTIGIPMCTNCAQLLTGWPLWNIHI